MRDGSERSRIERSRRDAMLGGVCAGMARHFGWSVTGTRVGYVILSIFSAAFPGILVYIILWLLLPQARD
jgi:phage shock protein C